jgi:hypothetical protein
LIVSHAMLDTLETVLKRMPILAPFAEIARDQVGAAAGAGRLAAFPSIVLGGTAAYPLLDQEDAGVLNAAMAGQSDIRVTNNIADFIRGPRARTDTIVLSRHDGRPDAVRMNHPRHPAGLIIASPPRAVAWIVRGVPPPSGVLAAFNTGGA